MTNNYKIKSKKFLLVFASSFIIISISDLLFFIIKNTVVVKYFPWGSLYLPIALSICLGYVIIYLLLSTLFYPFPLLYHIIFNLIVAISNYNIDSFHFKFLFYMLLLQLFISIAVKYEPDIF